MEDMHNALLASAQTALQVIRRENTTLRLFWGFSVSFRCRRRLPVSRRLRPRLPRVSRVPRWASWPPGLLRAAPGTAGAVAAPHPLPPLERKKERTAPCNLQNVTTVVV